MPNDHIFFSDNFPVPTSDEQSVTTSSTIEKLKASLGTAIIPSDNHRAILLRISRHYFFTRDYEKLKSCVSQLEQLYPDIQSSIEFIVLKFNVLFLAGKTRKAQDVLEHAITQEWSDENKHTILYYLGKAYFWNGDYVRANQLLQRCYHYYISVSDHYMIGSVLFMLGYIAFQKSYFDISESYYIKALEQFKAIKKSNELRKTYHMLGILAYRTGRYGEAKINLTKAKKWAVKSDNRIGVINSNIALARLSMYFADSKHAESLLARSYDKSKEFGYERGIALSAEFLGEQFYHLGKYAESLAYLEEARRLAIEIAPRGDIAVEVYRRLGDVYTALERFEEAERVLNHALDIADSLHDQYEQGSIFRALGVLA